MGKKEKLSWDLTKKKVGLEVQEPVIVLTINRSLLNLNGKKGRQTLTLTSYRLTIFPKLVWVTFECCLKKWSKPEGVLLILKMKIKVKANHYSVKALKAVYDNSRCHVKQVNSCVNKFSTTHILRYWQCIHISVSIKLIASNQADQAEN